MLSWWSFRLWGCLSFSLLYRVSSEPKKELLAERVDDDSDLQGQ